MTERAKPSIWNCGHLPTLVAAFLYFDFSFMVWTLLGPLSVHIKETLHLTDQQAGLMVAVPNLGGAILRIALGFLVDRLGAKQTGIVAQLVIIFALSWGWMMGAGTFGAVLLLGFSLGFAGASFAVALPQAGRWYPPSLQGTVLGLAGAGNMGVVLDALAAPRLANAFGWRAVFGLALVPAFLVLAIYVLFSKEAPGEVKRKRLADYLELLRDKDTYWFCFFYTITFGGFAGLAATLVMYFKGEHGLTKVQAGDWAALCTFVGVMSRPLGGMLADRLGGTRSLTLCYLIAGAMLMLESRAVALMPCILLFVVALAALGAGNGAVFQLLPQRFNKELGLMTGLVGAGGGFGAFFLATSLGWSKGQTGSYATGLAAFAVLCFFAFTGLTFVKKRWRNTWGALAAARI